MSTLPNPEVIALWDEADLNLNAAAPPEEEYRTPPAQQKRVRNISRPTLSVYLPDPTKATGTGVVVAPGGAFHFLAIEHEGTMVAEWLVERGVAAFILKYRVIPTPGTLEDIQQQMQARFANRGERSPEVAQYADLGVADGQQAVRLVRENAERWGVDRDRVGMIGFSAGGYVTLGTILEGDAACRPNFATPIYPAFWKDIVVPPDAPPLFLTMASDDAMAVRSSLPVVSAWRDAGRPVELHLFADGGHGFGMNKKNLPVDHWIELYGTWLGSLGLLARQ
ncbi:MAG TPA: alpha/beta hydrolase [Chloroflexota bacterium]|nr:alpha/beta hydrolase [Chloroflexota bacterium]